VTSIAANLPHRALGACNITETRSVSVETADGVGYHRDLECKRIEKLGFG
jgi:hypothetical protein